MKKHGFWQWLGLGAALLCLLASPALAAEGTWVDLGTLGGNTSEAYGINNRGQIVGISATAAGVTHAFLYENGVMTDLGIPEGGTGSWAYAINNNKTIVGKYTYPPWGASAGCKYYGGAWTDLKPLDIGDVRAINVFGQIVGGYAFSTWQVHPYIYSGGVRYDLGTLGGDSAWALGINSYGHVVGVSTISPGALADSHAFLYANGFRSDLGTLGGNYSCAYGINDLGQIVGEAATATGAKHAFLYENGVMTDLGTLGGEESCAYAINNRGQIVGTACVYDPFMVRRHAFLYYRGVMTDLGYPPFLPGNVDNRAFAINDLGQIVGYIRVANYNRAFLYNSPPLPNVAGYVSLLLFD
jgi:probable HAF family extracellular repeat protein